MFAGYGVIVDNKDLHIIRLYLRFVGIDLLMIGVHQRYGNGKGSTIAFFTLDLNLAVHHLDDILRYSHTETGAAVFIGSGAVLLTECVKDMGEIFLAHTYTGVSNNKAECRSAAEFCGPLNGQLNAAALGSELDRVSENIYKHLTQLHIVADVVIVDLAQYAAVVGLLVFRALSAENGIYLSEQLGEGEILVFQYHSAALYP